MKKENQPNVNLLESLSDLAELEKFIHSLDHKLLDSKLKPGTDLLTYSKKQKIKIPQFLEDATVESINHDQEDKFTSGLKRRLVLVRPNKHGNELMAIRVGCVRIRTRWGTVVVCLECGWIWCRIVIYF
jgi:hypothetical protein